MPAVITPPIVKTKLALAVAQDASLTVTVMVVFPPWPGSGVIIRLLFVPPALTTILVFGTSAGLEDVAVMTRLLAGVSPSSTVNGIGGVGTLRAELWSRKALMMGGVLLGGSLIKAEPVAGTVFVQSALQFTRFEDP